MRAQLHSKELDKKSILRYYEYVHKRGGSHANDH